MGYALLLATFATSIPTVFRTGMTVAGLTVCARSGGLVRTINRSNSDYKEYATSSKERITFLTEVGINTKGYYG